mmetsp:Transcript_21811/g.54070  ORF Transcript_21811/g.54070 Transcript_21811/m.54070 type:complete len:215 (+) Transcript_21811:766-1410(+)
MRMIKTKKMLIRNPRKQTAACTPEPGSCPRMPSSFWAFLPRPRRPCGRKSRNGFSVSRRKWPLFWTATIPKTLTENGRAATRPTTTKHADSTSQPKPNFQHSRNRPMLFLEGEKGLHCPFASISRRTSCISGLIFESSEIEEDCPFVQPKGHAHGEILPYNNMNGCKSPTIVLHFLTMFSPSILALPLSRSNSNDENKQQSDSILIVSLHEGYP